jgi:hypothetical protein
MHKDLMKKEMTSTQLVMLAYQTYQWWNAVLVQANRFFDVLEKNHGGTPWDEGDENSMFIAERAFLIMAIHHAIEDLEKLDSECQRKGDTSLELVLQAIGSVAPLEDIKNLRDMNEHNLDYLMDEGRKQDQFRSVVKKNGYAIHTTAAWTIVHDDAQTMLLGNVEIDELLNVMKEQLPFVREKTKEVFDKGLSD